MKITLFTSNQLRHNYFINLLSKISRKLFVVQEKMSKSSNTMSNHYPSTTIFKDYFSNVIKCQKKIFGNTSVDGKRKNIKLLSINPGDLNKYSLKKIKDFLSSDLYIVYGSSYIKGELVNFLIKKKAINIHMGISPYYRGTDCNFWALYDNNSHLVGSTIHLLSKGVDSGSILYHALSEETSDPFLYSMNSVKSAFVSLTEKIKDKSIFKIKEINQEKSKEIRYSKKKDFNEDVIRKFLKKRIYIYKNLDMSLYKDAYFLKIKKVK